MKKKIVYSGLSKEDIENLGRIVLCAEWVVGQFEAANCQSIANIFREAIDDANAWIHNMVSHEDLSESYSKTMRQREVEILHSILVRYASINNSEVKEKALERMISAIEVE